MLSGAPMSPLRILAPALVAGLLLGAGVSHASVIYDLTLTPTSGSIGGTGSFTIASTPPATGQVTYSEANGNLSALSFLIDGQTFTLAGDTAAKVVFLNGSLSDITFAEQIGTSPNRFDLQTSGVYAFYYNNELSESAGNFTATLASDLVPEPASLALFATALGL